MEGTFEQLLDLEGFRENLIPLYYEELIMSYRKVRYPLIRLRECVECIQSQLREIQKQSHDQREQAETYPIRTVPYDLALDLKKTLQDYSNAYQTLQKARMDFLFALEPEA